MHELLRLLDGTVAHDLDEIVGATMRLDDLHELVRQELGAVLRFGMRREDHRVAGLEREHAVAHRRHDRVGDRCNGTDHAHWLRDERQIRLGVLADDAARLLVLEVVPDDAGLALLLEHLVLVVADAGLVDGHSRQHLRIVVNVLADVSYDSIDLLLSERLEGRLGRPPFSDQILNFCVGNDCAFCGAHDRFSMKIETLLVL